MSYQDNYYYTGYKGIPALWDYDAAKQAYESVKPLRGSNNVRPLGHRRNKEVQIVERQNIITGESNYAVCYYDTDVVTFYPSGEIGVQHGGWNTVTTAMVIQAALAESCFIQHNHMWITYDNYSERSTVRIPQDEELRVKRMFVDSGHRQLRDDGKWSGSLVLVDGAPTTTVYKVNRKQANNVRQKFKEFRKYVSGTSKLLGEAAFTKEFFKGVFGVKVHSYIGYGGQAQSYETVKEVPNLNISYGLSESVVLEAIDVMLSEGELESKHKLMCTFAYQCQRPTPANILRKVDDLLFFCYREDVFDEVEVPATGNKRETNAKFFDVSVRDDASLKVYFSLSLK